MPVLRRVLLTTAAMLLLGVAAGVVWVLLAEPAQWEVTRNGLVLTEAASRDQFSVVVVFLTVGAATSVVWGLLAGWTLRDLGWTVTPLVIAATLVAAVIAWQLGIALGPPPPESVSGLSQGDRVPDELMVDSFAPFLIWPVAGLVGLILTTWASGRGESDPTTV